MISATDIKCIIIIIVNALMNKSITSNNLICSFMASINLLRISRFFLPEYG